MKANERFCVGQRVRFGYAKTGFVSGIIKEITFGGAKAGIEPTALVEADEDGTQFITPQSMISLIDVEPMDAHSNNAEQLRQTRALHTINGLLNH